MVQTGKQQHGSLPAAWLAAFSILMTVLGFGAVVWLVTLEMEAQIREQIVTRDAEALQAVIRMNQLAEKDLDPGFTVRDEAAQFHLLLQASRLRGVLAVRLFDAEGKQVMAFPDYVPPGTLRPALYRQAKRLLPAGVFEPASTIPAELRRRVGSASQSSEDPILEVAVPLVETDGRDMLGVAQFIMDGTPAARRIEAMHRTVQARVWTVFAIGSVLIVTGLGWAMHRLQERTRLLQAANQELAFAAKTAAVGAISSHLIHGLKSPIFGLQNLALGRPAAGPESEVAWETALRTTRQMSDLISRIVGILQDQSGAEQMEASLGDLLLDVRARLQPHAAEAEVALTVRALPENTAVTGRVANLTMIILTNLTQNAIEVSPAGGQVTVKGVTSADGTTVFEVQDQGPGVPLERQSALFLPYESTKPGGSGLGLSICQQLAGHLDGRLEFRPGPAGGAIFRFELPARHLLRKPDGSSWRKDSNLVV